MQIVSGQHGSVTEHHESSTDIFEADKLKVTFGIRVL